MRTAVSVVDVSRAYALALALGLAFLGMGVGLAHSEPRQAAGPMQVAPTQIAQGVLPPLPDNSFVCHAKPGGWCDLRDWRGFGQMFGHTTVN